MIVTRWTIKPERELIVKAASTWLQTEIDSGRLPLELTMDQLAAAARILGIEA